MGGLGVEICLVGGVPLFCNRLLRQEGHRRLPSENHSLVSGKVAVCQLSGFPLKNDNEAVLRFVVGAVPTHGWQSVGPVEGGQEGDLFGPNESLLRHDGVGRRHGRRSGSSTHDRRNSEGGGGDLRADAAAAATAVKGKMVLSLPVVPMTLDIVDD